VETKDVGVVMGSISDREFVEEILKTLDSLGVTHAARVISAHRAPEILRRFILETETSGCCVLIGVAGGAAHLPGVMASMTTLPVIGVPVPTEHLGGIDSLYSIVQMPAGVPVATVGVGKSGATNAAILAAQIVAQKKDAVKTRLKEHKKNLEEKCVRADREFQSR